VSEKQKMLEAILARACVDPLFRRRLIADPRMAIRDAFGLVVPEGFRMRFIERDPDVDALVVLPDLEVPARHQELPEEDLRLASGGWSRPRGTGWDRN
jgi:hypothetical protein